MCIRDSNEKDPDYGNYLPTAKYQVMGLSEGTVVATGTPIDAKNDVKPVTITITVTKGSTEMPKLEQIAQDSASAATDYILSLIHI